jgi:hypothetical protein
MDAASTAKENGNAAFKKGLYLEAAAAYTKCLKHITDAKVHAGVARRLPSCCLQRLRHRRWIRCRKCTAPCSAIARWPC